MKQNLTYLVDRFCKLTILHHTYIEQRAVKVRTVVRHQIGGQVVDFTPAFPVVHMRM